jgi:FkbM family methyltransferase
MWQWAAAGRRTKQQGSQQEGVEVSNSPWRRAVKRAARSVGFDVIRFRPESSASAKIAAVMRHAAIDLVLDVGANEGQFANEIRDAGYEGSIVSFEPLRDAHARLSASASGQPNWKVHERCAIGDSDGDVKINVAGNSVSSSIRPMLEQHAKSAPASRYVGTETVPLRRLDSVAPAYLAGARSVYLKIDTQGYEAAVLRGAPTVLQQARAVQLEMSLIPLYEGQELWGYFLEQMQGLGFVPWTLLPGFVDDATGRTLQIDAVFLRL